MSAVADYLEVLSKQLADSAIAIRNLEHKIAYQQHLIRKLSKMADENKFRAGGAKVGGHVAPDTDSPAPSARSYEVVERAMTDEEARLFGMADRRTDCAQ